MFHKARECQASGRAFRNAPWSVAGCEPRLEDVLADPLVHQLMRSDGIEPAQLRALLAGYRARQSARAAHCRCAA